MQFLCVLLLIVGRVVNFLLPWTLGELVRVFETPSNRSPWLLLFGYVGLRFLQSGGGLGALRDVSFSACFCATAQDSSISWYDLSLFGPL
jgi:hypothetical protein